MAIGLLLTINIRPTVSSFITLSDTHVVSECCPCESWCVRVFMEVLLIETDQRALTHEIPLQLAEWRTPQITPMNPNMSLCIPPPLCWSPPDCGSRESDCPLKCIPGEVEHVLNYLAKHQAVCVKLHCNRSLSLCYIKRIPCN